MKIIKSFIFLALILSCSDKKTENQVSEFEKILGNDNVVTLNFLVSNFEKDFLARQYPNLNTENACRQFLTELRDKKTDNWMKISQKAIKKFKSSDLRLEMYKFPDSVWVLKNSTFDKIESDSLAFLETSGPYVKSRFKSTNPEGITKYRFGRSYGNIMHDSNFDSIIKRELEIPRINFIGKYFQALELIKNKSDFHREFFETKKSRGFLYPESIARVMLNYDIDLRDKLNRKIIVLEFIY